MLRPPVKWDGVLRGFFFLMDVGVDFCLVVVRIEVRGLQMKQPSAPLRIIRA